MRVSRRLNLLSILSLYIDFILVGAVVTLVSYGIGKGFNFVSGDGLPFVIENGLSALLVGVARLLGLSAGRPLLAYARTETVLGSGRRIWPNLLLGTLLVLDGLKQLVRWTQLDTTLPVFGMVEPTPLKIVVTMALGALGVCAGLVLLAFAPKAKYWASAAIAASVVDLLVSWPNLPEGIERATRARRVLQGRTVREGEIVFMQTALPYSTAIFLLVFIAILYLCRTRDGAEATEPRGDTR